jgi:hypothetical protein
MHARTDDTRYLEEVITERFLEITKDDLEQMIASRRDALDVKLLLFALKVLCTPRFILTQCGPLLARAVVHFHAVWPTACTHCCCTRSFCFSRPPFDVSEIDRV